MSKATLFLSVKPIFADKILSGEKTVELRRVFPDVAPGTIVLIYSSSPEMALIGSAEVADVLSGTPSAVWKLVKEEAGESRREYDDYFSGADTAVGIWLRSVRRFAKPISLQDLRKRWPWLRPPQSYRYVDATLGPKRATVKSLALPARSVS